MNGRIFNLQSFLKVMARTRMWILCSLLLVVIHTTGADYQLPTQRWQGTLSPQNGRTTYYHLRRTPEQHSIVTWNYDILVPNYDPARPKPFIFFRQQQRSREYFTSDWTCLEITVFAFQDPRLVELQDRYCNLQNGTLRCTGEIKFAAAYPVYWQASVAYSCSETRPYLDLSYNITLTPYANITCRSVNEIANIGTSAELQTMLDEVRPIYRTYSPWNFFGLSSTSIRYMATLYQPLTNYTCYQHLSELLLRLTFPECRDGQVIYQCFEMCGDFRDGCDIANVLFVYTRGCYNLQNRGLGPCVYREVLCTVELKAPSHGSIESDGNITIGSTRTVSCESGYDLSGNDTAVCGYGGTWETSKYPSCTKKSEPLDNSIIIIPIIVGCLIALIIILVFIVYAKFRFEVIVLMFKYCPWLLCCARFHKRYDIKLHDAFVAYHYEDLDFVRSNIQEPLENLGYKLFVDDRDGNAGQAIMRYMADAIAQSHRVILLLSQHFLDDRTCAYMLDQAFYQTLEGQQFQVIIVLMAERKQLKNIPRFMRVFMRAGKTIHKDDPMFLATLSNKMPAQSVGTVSQGTHDSIQEHVAPLNSDSIVLEE